MEQQIGRYNQFKEKWEKFIQITLKSHLRNDKMTKILEFPASSGQIKINEKNIWRNMKSNKNNQ